MSQLRNDMCKWIYLIFLSIIALSMMGCVPRTLESSAYDIYLIPSPIFDTLKCCTFLAPIRGYDIHGASTAFASSTQLEADDTVYLRNQGAKLGANLVVFNQHEIIATPHNSPIPKRHYYTKVIHNIQGTAYLCPVSVKKSLWMNTIGTHYTFGSD